MMSIKRTVMAPIEAGCTMVREAVALSRNYRHAAILRRQLRTKYGAAVGGSPTVLMGEALTVAQHAPWIRLVVLTVLLLAAVRIK